MQIVYKYQARNSDYDDRKSKAPTLGISIYQLCIELCIEMSILPVKKFFYVKYLVLKIRRKEFLSLCKIVKKFT